MHHTPHYFAFQIGSISPDTTISQNYGGCRPISTMTNIRSLIQIYILGLGHDEEQPRNQRSETISLLPILAGRKNASLQSLFRDIRLQVKLCNHHVFHSPDQAVLYSVQTHSSHNARQHVKRVAKVCIRRKLPYTTKPSSSHIHVSCRDTAIGCTRHRPQNLSVVNAQSPDCQCKCHHTA